MNDPAERAGFAIIGMAGRFPGAPTLFDFWRNLCDGVESITTFAADELEAPPSDLSTSRDFVSARAILDDVDLFDASFFGITARDAELIDPQHRLFLEASWSALEDAGYEPATYSGTIGVFAGCTINTYVLRNVLSSREAVTRFTNEYQVGSYPELLGAGQDFLATRVAYKLDLRGPAMTIQSACSTSLVAVAQACSALSTGQADIMLAGAVSISFPQKRGYVHQAGGMVSADGHCRAFDAASSGTVFGDGVGVVVLKRLEDAIRDGDSVYAVIRGVGVNNDGSEKAGYTAPSPSGEAGAIAAAHAMARFDPRTIRYVECHGTGTPLGDPIEFAALARTFPVSDANPYCALGSVKTNIGHLDVAAGMSGLIKTVLAIHHGKIPPTLHFRTPNPRIPFAGSPFFVNTDLIDWPADDRHRRAGVSAFGVGGTNAHVVLEARPAHVRAARGTDTQLVVISARSPSALSAARVRLAEYLRAAPELDLADVAFTLQAGRRHFAHRLAITAASVAEAASRLDQGAPRPEPPARPAPALAFMFPGQGAQYVNMGRGLYDRLPLFRETVERCAAILAPLIGHDLCASLYPQTGVVGGDGSLASTELAQPALFAVEYALAQVWLSWGLVPSAMIGHSVGEFVAATIAGVFTLEDALAIVAHRGRLMQAIPQGAMLAVRLNDVELDALLVPPLCVAAANSPKLSVASGPFAAIEQLERTLTERGVAFRRLATSHAFHSPMMDSVLEPLLARLRQITLREPQMPYVSGVTGDWITVEEATSPEYWARHCREAIRFEAGIRTIVDGGTSVLLEVGPGTTLKTFAQQTIDADAEITISGSVRDASLERSDHSVLLESLGKLWCVGLTPDWSVVHAPAVPGRVSLPTYPFERRRHWLDAPVQTLAAALKAVGIPPIAVAIPPIALATPPRLEDTPLPHVSSPGDAANESPSRQLTQDLIVLLEELSGETITTADLDTTFLELGFDSLFLGRFVQKLNAAFGISITFRALLTDLPTIESLAVHISTIRPVTQLVQTARVVVPDTQSPSALASPASAGSSLTDAGTVAGTTIEAIVREQLAAMQQLMREQLAAVQGRAGTAALESARATVGASAAPSAGVPIGPALTDAGRPSSAENSAPQMPSRFEAYRPGSSGGGAARNEVTVAQRTHIANLIERTVQRTQRSKDLTARHRAALADPRVAAGFRPEWKEMVYPIACDRAKGSRLWDVDGNEYIDILNGFGQTAFGHSPDFVVAAIEQQMRSGFPIGPQTPLAGEVAELFCELTGNERVTFCNTGSEAVMAALRLARTVTGRDRVVMFSGAYHGQFDEVLVKAARTSHRALPVAPGIPAESVANMVVLPYADPASLQWVREHAAELAAVVVEPVQSRHPDLQPKDFLTEIRAITQASGTAFVMDEVVTGFRMHPGGMQAVFGIRADLATYGKVAGGGMPIGILAGSARFMDALDGGSWQYGDDSSPDVPPTFFAGTFVRHPLTMAAVLAVLRHLKEAGPALQARLSASTTGLVARLNAALAQREIASRIETYGSLFFFNFTAEERLASLLYYHLRLRGVYIQEGFPCFLTTAHSAADIDTIVAAFGQSLDELQAVGIFGSPVPPVASLDIPLTEQQTEIWLAAQISDDASCAFNESITLRLQGALDEAAFAAAWDAIVARHDALRSAFNPTGEYARIAPVATLAYERSDVSADGPTAAEAALATVVALDAAAPFDLFAGPLVRGTLVRLDRDQHAFVFTAHHIICDGWSINVILEEFAALYAANRTGTPINLPRPLAFSRYALTRAQRDPAELARIETFWLDAFREPVSALHLPTDRPRPAMRSFRGATTSIHIDAQRYRAIKRAGARQGCTLFVTLLGAFDALIGSLAATRDVVIGVPAAGQALLDGETLVGHCVDFLPIRTRWSAGASLSELLALTKTRVLAAYEHQDYTLGTLVRTLAPIRETNRVPLAEIQFNLERLAQTIALPDLAATMAPNAKAFVNFDLFLNAIESDAGLRFDCDYNTDIFDAARIDRWMQSYVEILDAIVEDATRLIGDMTFAAVPAVRESVASAPAITGGYPADATIGSLIAAQAALRPDALAATCGNATVTYAQLEARTTQLARRLNHRFGRAGGRVGICLPRSLDMLVALIATLKAGFAYVPLDPTHPPARLQHVLNDAGVVALIAGETLGPTVAPAGTPIIDVGDGAADQALNGHPQILGEPRADSLAYTIYTSGSTGKPKGVDITHRSVVNFLFSMAREPGFTAADTMLAVTTISFDIAGLELYLPLITGGTVAIADDAETRDGLRLHERLIRSQATALQATPATWRMLLETEFVPPAGFKLLCGGEALRRELADRLLARGGDLWNMYGPTETTIWSSCGRVAPRGPVTVGRPIANTSFHILDAGDVVVPSGSTGQLHIGGDGVARGYVNLDALTAQRFIANPFGAGRLYRTGDTARLLPSGEFEILGRMDDQVKLRGYRIELGEIEATLTRDGAVAAAAVALQEREQRLIAYYVERTDAPVNLGELQSMVARHVPEYMIPAVWMRLDALPLNTNGKVDRAALPAPAVDEWASFVAPRTPTEQALAAIWADVLARERVSIHDDIFVLGADSIQIFQITARANRKGLSLVAKQLMKLRTIAELAKTLDHAGATPTIPGVRLPARVPRSPFKPAGDRHYAPLP